jgi:hypothetical protein
MHPLIKKLLALNLPVNDYAIFGSGPMFAHGLKDLGHDVDIIARGEAWNMATKFSKPQQADYGVGLVITLEDGQIEIYNNWAPGKWDINELIDTAEIVSGIKFVTLTNVLKWKKLFGRPKDFDHIKTIEAYLAS